MSDGLILDLWQNTLITAAKVAAPFVLGALAIGILTSLVQAATQIQENALSFVPKLVAVGLVLVLMGPWVLEQLVRSTRTTMSTMARIGEEAGR